MQFDSIVYLFVCGKICFLQFHTDLKYSSEIIDFINNGYNDSLRGFKIGIGKSLGIGGKYVPDFALDKHTKKGKERGER